MTFVSEIQCEEVFNGDVSEVRDTEREAFDEANVRETARACAEACARDEDDSAEDFDPAEDYMSDVEADADTLASCGWGTNEDYGYFGGDEW